jgi:hypothetical protein
MLTSSDDDFQSITISEDSTVSEGTRRLLSPYNRNRFDAVNREIQHELNRVKESFHSLTNDLNNFQGAPEQLKEFKENRILLNVRQRHEMLDDRNEQMLLDLQHYIWEIAKYVARIEIYLCTIEQLKQTANEYLQLAKKSAADQFGTSLKNEIDLLQMRSKQDCPNAFIRQCLEQLQQRCSTIRNLNDRTQLKGLRNLPVKKSILGHCRNRLLD